MYITLKFLESNIDSLNQLDQITDQIMKDYNIDSDKYANILISLTEAVSNAIIHGNGEKSAKEVEISITETDAAICLKVTDQGVGFDYKAIPDPTTPDNVVKQGGRGIFLIRDLSDKIVFLNNGSAIEMFFNR